MVLICCCRVAIMVRSCSSLVKGGWVPRGIPPVTVVVGKILAIAMAIVMIPCRRMNGLLYLYL